MRGYHVAIVGATGAVGQELLRVLERRSFPAASLRPIGSARSAGKSVQFCDESIPVQELATKSFDKIDIAFFSAGGEISRKHVPVSCQADAIAIDNSSAPRFWRSPDFRRKLSSGFRQRHTRDRGIETADQKRRP